MPAAGLVFLMSKPVPRHITALTNGMFSAFQEQCALLMINFKAAAGHSPLTYETKKSLAYEFSRLWMMAYNAVAVDVFPDQAAEIKSSLEEANKMAESIGIDPKKAICLELADYVVNEVLNMPIESFPAGSRSLILYQITAGILGRNAVKGIRVKGHSYGVDVAMALNTRYLSDEIRGKINDELIMRGVMPILNSADPEIP